LDRVRSTTKKEQKMTTWKVSHIDAKKTLRAFLKEKLGEGYSVRKIKWNIDHHLVSVNGKVERHSTVKLVAGDVVDFNTKNITDNTIEKKRILYEDDAILAYDKPPRMTTMGKGLLEILRRKYRDLEPVHRLDRDTSGVVLFAKDKKYLEAMTQQFRDNIVEKVYWAVVDGVIKDESGIIENRLAKIGENHGRAVWGKVAHGKEAVTRWRCIKTGRGASVVECRPKTGRTHQIRVHLNGIGHPVLGDVHYGKRFRCRYRPSRVMLHAKKISFKHPMIGDKINITAPIPDDMKEAIRYTNCGMVQKGVTE